MRPYYEAYEERYRTVHEKGLRWSSEQRTPIVLETIEKYLPDRDTPMLEIGCGEGRDAKAVLDKGYSLLATDLSQEAIAYCREKYPEYAGRFETLDAIRGDHPFRYGFLYSVAVIHMLVLQADRDAFYRFVREHLTDDGVALICSMGDGMTQQESNIDEAFQLQEREHTSGKMLVAATSCRMVSLPAFEKELVKNGLRLIEKGLTAAPPDFGSLLYAVVRR